MNTRNAAAGLAIMVAGVGLSACGSSSDSGDKGLSRSALVAKANAICKKAQTSAEAIQAPASFADPTTAAAYFDQIAPLTETETNDLLALKADDDAQADFAAFTKAQSAANDLLQTIKGKADSKDASGLDDLKKVQPAGDRVAAAAKKLGATTCG
jgi:hypothetical protein